MVHKLEKKSNCKRRICFSLGLSVFLGVSLLAGYQLQRLGYTWPGWSGKLKLLFAGFLLGLVFCPFLERLFWYLEQRTKQPVQSEQKKWKSGKVFLISFLGIWLCYLPVWLAYYPVIMSYDFHRQSMEAFRGISSFNNHHPLIHTWLIYVFKCLGEGLGSYVTGFALFSLFQQGITAAVLGYACAIIYRLTEKKTILWCSGVFFGCFPLISVFVMCTTKDVLFGAFFILFLLLLIENQFVQRQGKQKVFFEIMLVLAGTAMMLFRNNALYAMPVFAIFYLILSQRGARFRRLILLLLICVLAKGGLWGMQQGFHAHKGSEIEKYSVIYQTMARVGNRQGKNLSAEEFTLLDTYVTAECWADYNPPLADTIKEPIQKNNFKKHAWDNKFQLLKDWVKLGMRYENEYMDAFLDLTRGYWFLEDTSHAEMLGVGLEDRMGLLYTYNAAYEEYGPELEHVSKFPWLENQLEKLLSENCYERVPVIRLFFRPAFWCLFLLGTAVWLWYGKRWEKLQITLYPIAYFCTMLLGPTAVVRYVYQFILLAPILVALVLEKSGGQKHELHGGV